MSYYPDLTKYKYDKEGPGLPSKHLNVGWLQGAFPFDTAPPEKWLIDKLWAHCRFAVHDTRGYQPCDLPKCNWDSWYAYDSHPIPYITEEDLDYYEKEGLSPHPNFPTVAEYRKKQKLNVRTYERQLMTVTHRWRKLRLGTSEIRIFGPNDLVYAAPDLLFHYVRDHHYKMPDQVIDALRTGPCPPELAWFDRLRATGTALSWIQCMQRMMRTRFKKGEKKTLAVFDAPTAPVKWIPETLDPSWLQAGRREAFGLRQSPGAFPEKPNHRPTAKPKGRARPCSARRKECPAG